MPWPKRYADIYPPLWLHRGSTDGELVPFRALCDQIRSFNVGWASPSTLKDFGIDEKGSLTREAGRHRRQLAVGDACTGSNPRPIRSPPPWPELFTCIYYGTEVDF